MRVPSSLLLSFPLFLPATIAVDSSPFYAPFLERSNPALDPRDVAQLDKREQSCPDRFGSCALLGSEDACCQEDTICSRDDANNMACCPKGASCTGVLTRSGDGPTNTNADPTSSGFMFPQPGSSTITPGPRITGSTVENAPFPFVYIPTTFPNPEQCVSYYSACESQYSACQSSLGGVNGVTVNGGNGDGITVEGARPTGDAHSICFSLSQKACYGLQEAYCPHFTDGSSGNMAAGRSVGGIYELMAGIIIAVAGMIT
ncbi:hypothetical protein AJ80_09376 [Polytolypa hystricis UAMH7299]|uniref:Uncharacterized protein n=1 Tax=Polytolypa hystricis (strain UAMH7299) TaxID=1447883 RepID=A0A2B7WSC4_POLH7|nr:hypothetical protein AJ80_09376 [Polytolypa hystricis UAMH7299]